MPGIPAGNPGIQVHVDLVEVLSTARVGVMGSVFRLLSVEAVPICRTLSTIRLHRSTGHPDPPLARGWQRKKREVRGRLRIGAGWDLALLEVMRDGLLRWSKTDPTLR